MQWKTENSRKVDTGKIWGMVLLVLENAFYFVDFWILLGKFRAITAVKWVQSDLTGRCQKMDLNGTLVLSP